MNHYVDYSHFVESLGASVRSQHIAAAYLKRLGYSVLVNPVDVAESESDAPDMADSGDLTLQLRVEVKHRKDSFSGRDDFPFKLVLLDGTRRLDGKLVGLHGFVIVSNDCRAVCMVPASTRPHWVVKDVINPSIGREEPCYLVPVELAKFGVI